MFQKKGVGKRRLVFLAASPLVTAPPSNLTRLYYNGSAVKSHSTILQRLRRQISLDYYTIPPATQAIGRPILHSFKKVMTSYKESNKHDLN